MKTYRHWATSPYGTFRRDFHQRYPYAVIHCGWDSLPHTTADRLKNKEGRCLGWARNEAEVKKLFRQASEEGCLSILCIQTEIEELPWTPTVTGTPDWD